MIYPVFGSDWTQIGPKFFDRGVYYWRSGLKQLQRECILAARTLMPSGKEIDSERWLELLESCSPNGPLKQRIELLRPVSRDRAKVIKHCID